MHRQLQLTKQAYVYLLSELRHRCAISVPWIDSNFFRIFLMGPSHHARHQCPQQDLPRPHVPHERTGDGHQGHFVVPQCATDRSIVGCLGTEVLPPHHRVLHLRPHSTDVD